MMWADMLSPLPSGTLSQEDWAFTDDEQVSVKKKSVNKESSKREGCTDRTVIGCSFERPSGCSERAASRGWSCVSPMPVSARSLDLFNSGCQLNCLFNHIDAEDE